jgi:hypothetical protein
MTLFILFPNLLLRVQFRMQTFDFLTLTFHFLHLRFKVRVMLPVEGGGEVFGRERHGKRRLVAEVRLVVNVLQERRLDYELLAVRAVWKADVVVQAGGELAIDFCLSVVGDDYQGILHSVGPSVHYLCGVFACRLVNYDADKVLVYYFYLDFRHDAGGFGAVVTPAGFSGQQEAEQVNVVRRHDACGITIVFCI